SPRRPASRRPALLRSCDSSQARVEAILLPAVVHDLQAAVAEALLRVEVGNPELAVIRGDAQLDRLDAAPTALLDRVPQQARAQAAPARRRLHPDLLDLGARAAAGRDADRRRRDGGLVGHHEEPAARVAQDRLDVLLQVAHHPALVAEERLQELGDRLGVVGVRDPGGRRHSAAPQCSTAAIASAPAQATRSSTGTYSSTVWAHSMLRGPYPIDGVPPKRVKVAASYQESSPPRTPGFPAVAVARIIVPTIGSAGSTSDGGMSRSQSITGGFSASHA